MESNRLLLGDGVERSHVGGGYFLVSIDSPNKPKESTICGSIKFDHTAPFPVLRIPTSPRTTLACLFNRSCAEFPTGQASIQFILRHMNNYQAYLNSGINFTEVTKWLKERTLMTVTHDDNYGSSLYLPNSQIDVVDFARMQKYADLVALLEDNGASTKLIEERLVERFMQNLRMTGVNIFPLLVHDFGQRVSAFSAHVPTTYRERSLT